ncbi:MAG TPA: alpha/beta hydrolase [Solirubrobacterales bacterium]|nr:alpha/beta hydrolase [Solirubrobacterales bacterium]
MEVSHDGIRLHVEVEGGAGPPVVFIHGLTSSLETWSWLPSRITGGRRIIRLDLRGHGGSDHAPGTYLLERYGADLVAVLREVAGEPAVLVGHSLGGSVAWWTAQNHLELVRAALLEDPVLYTDWGPDEVAGLERDRDAIRAEQEAGTDPEELVRREAAEPVERPGRDGLTWGEVVDPADLLPEMRAILAADPETMTAMANRSTLAAIDVETPVTVPVLLLAAEAEAAFSEEHERRLSQTQPGVEMIRVAGSAHGIHAEIDPRPIFAARLAEFLDRHAPA